MKTLGTRALLVLGFLFAGITSQAQIPTGSYEGFINNNPFQEWCQLNRATMEFADAGEGRYELRWEESGFVRGMGSYCQNYLDATFIPTERANEWNVNFNSNFDMVFGKAVLEGNVLTITASYSGMSRPYQRFQARLEFNLRQIGYYRLIDRWTASSLMANGTLYSN